MKAKWASEESSSGSSKYTSGTVYSSWERREGGRGREKIRLFPAHWKHWLVLYIWIQNPLIRQRIIRYYFSSEGGLELVFFRLIIKASYKPGHLRT